MNCMGNIKYGDNGDSVLRNHTTLFQLNSSHSSYTAGCSKDIDFVSFITEPIGLRSCIPQ